MESIQKLIQYYQSLESLPESQEESTYKLLFDGIICHIIGMRHPDIIKMNKKLDSKFIPYIYASAQHAYDMDDTHDESIVHSNTIILSYLLYSIGQKKLVSGQDFLLSYFIGLDFGNRIGLSIKNNLHPSWLPTNIAGLYGGVLAEAILRKIYSMDEILQLLGYTLSFVGGSRQSLEEVTSYKKFQPGVATLHIQSIFDSFTPEILTYPKKFLDGNLGLYNMFGIENPDNSVFEESNYQVNKISIKPYPTCRCTHAVIDGALELRKKLIYEEIKKIQITLPPKAYAQVARFVDLESLPTSAQFSASICFSLAFVNGYLSYDLLQKNQIIKSKVISLENKIVYKKGSEKDKGVSPISIKVITTKEIIEYNIKSPSGKVTNSDIFDKINNKAKGFNIGNISKIQSVTYNISSSKNVNELLRTII